MNDFNNTPEFAAERAYGEYVGTRLATVKGNKEKAAIIGEANARINELNSCVDRQHSEILRLQKELSLANEQRNMAELLVVSMRQTLENVIDNECVSETAVKKVFTNIYNKKKINFIENKALTDESFRKQSIWNRMKNTVQFLNRMFK